MKRCRATAKRLRFEELEPRFVLSLIFGLDEAAGAATEPPDAAARSAPASEIRLDVVALHEFGHSLGLPHMDDEPSIMNSFYNPDYDFADFPDDPAVALLKSLYEDVEAAPWKNSLDPFPQDDQVDITYSFVPDGTRMEIRGGRSSMFRTFNQLFGRPEIWQRVFVEQLERWADNSDGKIEFHSHTDAGRRTGYFGREQNDSRSGDIRIGAHRFDGPGGTLAHAFFPPPSLFTVAGDAHFDAGEPWVLSGPREITRPSLAGMFGGMGRLRAPRARAALTVGLSEDGVDRAIFSALGESESDAPLSTIREARTAQGALAHPYLPEVPEANVDAPDEGTASAWPHDPPLTRHDDPSDSSPDPPKDRLARDHLFESPFEIDFGLELVESALGLSGAERSG